LELLRQQFVDVFDLLRLDESQVENAEYQKTLEANMIDPLQVKAGSCPLLVEVKGKRHIRSALVELGVKSMHSASSFVLDAGKTIYQWNGMNAPRVNKAKAMDLANLIRMKERGGVSQVITLDQGKNDAENGTFWRLLKGSADQVRELPADQIQEGHFYVRLYRILDKSVARNRRIQMIHDGSRLPPKELLDSACATVVDCLSEIYVYVGQKCSAYQRKLGLLVAKKLSTESHRPAWTSITRIIEKGETILFKEKFSNYPGMLPIHVTRHISKGNIAATQVQEDIDVSQMHEVTTLDPITYGPGRIAKVWRIEDFQKIEVPQAEYGFLYEGDSYIIWFTYSQEGSGKDKNLLYYWQGSESTRVSVKACRSVY
jgi:hypothetical protein